MCAGAARAAIAPSLPPTLSPPAPFPAVVAQSLESAIVAPGATLGLYRLWTSEGPLTVHVLALDLTVPTLRIGTVLAGDRVISGGETVLAMARRTGAIAGINADYFDIGSTNQPLNIVVRNGVLVRTPNGRAALAIGDDGSLHFGPYHFSGSAQDADRTWPLAAVNEWPPQGTSATLVTPAFGSLPATAGATAVTLTPAGAQTPGSYGGDYRVASIDDLDVVLSPRFALAFGPRAIAATAIPDLGDTVHLEAGADPSLTGIVSAVGGGPVLIAAGRPAVDPNPPSPGEAKVRAPQTGALRDAAGHLLLVTVDGRSPVASVGLNRAAFGALMQALGGVDGMAFDGGGSATLVARAGGDPTPSVQNVPSDGGERPVGDGLFVYSSAPAGAAERLVIRPARLDLLAGAKVELDLHVTDRAGNPMPLPAGKPALEVLPHGLAALGPGVTLSAAHPGSGSVRVRVGNLEASAALHVLSAPAHLAIEPADANPSPGQTVMLRAVARDAAGDPLWAGDGLQWTASSGTIAPDGRFRAGSSDAVITARIGSRTASTDVLVGHRTASLSVFDSATAWSFATAPRGGPGALAQSSGVLTLSYDFSGDTRAAYANADVTLPGIPLALVVDVRGDGNGAALRAAFRNTAGERVAVTLAKRVDWIGWRTCRVALPQTFGKLVSLYAVGSLGGPRVRATGTIALRDVRVTLAGSARARPGTLAP